MKICVIGGSGFIGTHLINLLKQDNEVTIIDRNGSKEFQSLVIKGDIRDRDFLIEKLRNFDVVINLAAEHRDDVSPVSLYYDVNVDGTRNILDAMDKNGLKNIIFTSSVAIYGLNNDNPDESHPAAPFNDYGKSKWEAEEVMREWYNKNPEGKTLSIIRPTVVFGEENRGNVYNLLNQMVNGKFMMIGKGLNKKSMAYVGNVVHFIEYLCKHGNGYQVYNYVDKPDFSTIDLVHNIEEALDLKIPSVKIPYWLGLMGGYGFDVLSKISGKKLPISSVRVKKFCATTQFDATGAHNSGFKIPYSIKEGLRKTLEYEFKNAE